LHVEKLCPYCGGDTNACCRDQVAATEWTRLGYSFEYTESGETDMGGFPISGDVVAVNGDQRIVMGTWGPHYRECTMRSPE